MPHVRTVFCYGPQAIKEGVSKVFLDTPFIIDEEGLPNYRLNEYFLARRNGDWMGPNQLAGLDAEVQGQSVFKAKPIYLRNRAYQLDTYRRWCRAQNVCPEVLNEQGIELYTEDLEEGMVTEYEAATISQPAPHLDNRLSPVRHTTRLARTRRLDGETTKPRPSSRD